MKHEYIHNLNQEIEHYQHLPLQEAPVFPQLLRLHPKSPEIHFVYFFTLNKRTDLFVCMLHVWWVLLNIIFMRFFYVFESSSSVNFYILFYDYTSIYLSFALFIALWVVSNFFGCYKQCFHWYLLSIF